MATAQKRVRIRRRDFRAACTFTSPLSRSALREFRLPRSIHGIQLFRIDNPAQRGASPVTMNSHRSLARVPITPYTLPSSECLAYNKITWQLSSERVVLLVHDMQNYWLDLFEDTASVVTHVARLLKLFRVAKLPVMYCRGERAQTRLERGLGLTVWGDGLNAAHVPEHGTRP